MSVITAFYFPSLGTYMQCSLKKEKVFLVFFLFAIYCDLLPIYAIYSLADRVSRDTACSDSEGTVENSRCHGGFK